MPLAERCREWLLALAQGDNVKVEVSFAALARLEVAKLAKVARKEEQRREEEKKLSSIIASQPGEQ